MKRILPSSCLILSLSILMSCNHPTTSTFEKLPFDWILYQPFNAFSFVAPPDLVAQHPRGIDSLVDIYTNSTFKIDFDYGPYTSDFKNNDELLLQSIIIDGHHATLATWKNGAALFVGDVTIDPVYPTMNTKLYMTILCDPQHVPDAELILRSIKFIPAK